jgi:four helix bundle protein
VGEFHALGVVVMYKNYQDLLVWQKAHELVKDIYNTSFNYGDDEKFGLNSQLKRAAVSVPANIVEGVSRRHNKEFLQFLYISKASLNEVSYYLLLCYDLKFLLQDDYKRLSGKCDEIERMLGSLISKVQKS